MFQNVWLFLVLVTSAVSGQLCANKTEYQCQCKRITDEKTHLPVDVADCSGLKIDTFPTDAEDDINYLSLSVNRIQILDPKQQKLSSNDLYVLILSHNEIKTINDEFFLTIPNLLELDLSHNYLTTLEDGLFQNLNKLAKLDLSYNNIQTLQDAAFTSLVNVWYLDLSYNPLGDFLTASKDTLSEKLGLNLNITHLHLNGLNISSFHNSYFDGFTNIKCLSLADNVLANIPTVPYSVEHLDLSGNNFTYVSARYLNYHDLKILKLNRMPSLTDVHHYAFYNLVSLEKLFINDCPNLKAFSELAFDVATKNQQLHPKRLSLARNGLSRLNKTYRYFFRDMDFVDLTHNPWKCDCDILWLTEFESILYKPQEIKCYLPRELRYKSILDIKEKDLTDCFPEIYGKKSHRILIIILASTLIVLIGLIFYLIKYPGSWLGNKHIVGPNSPYNLAATGEN
ncbi:hypothetical protein NQ318_003082 [Aromia moschata]|uniref:LRRCT domain-containing protein n=1 Tax=Aromia moschata TaxID=1265417 RepID=A0AAV8XT90_9CUCU|nr:hypothetical protein NQ318_003082 [Aromia moschata]